MGIFFALFLAIVSFTSIISCSNYYEKLGVRENASLGEITKAFRKLSPMHHPDKGGSHDKMAELNEIYETLKDDAKRRAYDIRNKISRISTETQFHQFDFTLADLVGNGPKVTFKLDGVGEFTMFRTPDLLLGKKKYLKDPHENVITDVISFRLIQGNQILNDLLLSKMTLIPGYGSDVMYTATILQGGRIQLPQEWCVVMMNANEHGTRDCLATLGSKIVSCPYYMTAMQCYKLEGMGIFFIPPQPQNWMETG